MITIINKRKTIPPKTAIRKIFVDFLKATLIETNPNEKFKYVIMPAIMKDFINSNETISIQYDVKIPAKTKQLKSVILRKK